MLMFDIQQSLQLYFTTMQLQEATKKSLVLSGNNSIISDETYKKLLENCFAVLLKKDEVHALSPLYNSKPDAVKEVYAALLTVSAEFARNNMTKDAVVHFLTADCKYSSARAETYSNAYEANKAKLRVVLVNVGTNLPHVVDANWKIDYIVKSGNTQGDEGPVYRISLLTEKNGEKEEVRFTCGQQELQDVVYKLKDAVRHCQRIACE